MLNISRTKLSLVSFLFFGATINLYAENESTLSPRVGIVYQGGIVACLNGEYNDFIVTKSDLSSRSPWGKYNVLTEASSVKNGYKNSQRILSVLGRGNLYAAQICANYQIDSEGNRPCRAGNICYKDWFLPAQEQLHCIYKNKSNIGELYAHYYWSSTEYSKAPKAYAIDQDLEDRAGTKYSVIKSTELGVRCIRAITP